VTLHLIRPTVRRSYASTLCRPNSFRPGLPGWSSSPALITQCDSKNNRFRAAGRCSWRRAAAETNPFGLARNHDACDRAPRSIKCSVTARCSARPALQRFRRRASVARRGLRRSRSRPAGRGGVWTRPRPPRHAESASNRARHRRPRRGRQRRRMRPPRAARRFRKYGQSCSMTPLPYGWARAPRSHSPPAGPRRSYNETGLRLLNLRTSFDLGQQEQRGALLPFGIRIVLRRECNTIESSSAVAREVARC
jgi:hypothetical protein